MVPELREYGDVLPPTAYGPAPLPAARGSRSEWLLSALAGPAGPCGVAPQAEDDPVIGDDSALTLYLLYELHYRGLQGVDDRWKWEPELLRARQQLERDFIERLRDEVPMPPPPDNLVEDLQLRAQPAANVVALALYGVSPAARRTGRRGLGRGLGLAGFGVTSAAGYLGGHLSYGRGVGVNNAFLQHRPDDWRSTTKLAELSDGKPQRVDVGDATVLLVRQGDTVHAIGGRCSHAGGPLDEGDINADSCTVTCPRHQSEFRLDTGAVVHGPASVPQPAYETRIVNGHVEVRARQP